MWVIHSTNNDQININLQKPVDINKNKYAAFV